MKNANPLKTCRERAGHKQFDLQVYTGISQSRLSRLENSPEITSQITMQEALKLNEYFNLLSDLPEDTFSESLLSTNQTRGQKR